MKRHSIHIGIDRYEDDAIQNLPFCKADARLLASFFQDVAEYESVTVLSDPTRNSILDAVSDEADRLNPGDMLVLSYSGHGFRSRDQHFIGAADSRMLFIREGVDGVPLAVLKRVIDKAGCDCAFFIDACPDVGMGTRDIKVSNPSDEKSGRDLDFYSSDAFKGTSFTIMAPEMSIESTSLGHGIFTAALDRALREAHAAGKPAMDSAFYELVNKHAKAICQESGLQNPFIWVKSCGHTANLW